jgi:hypothetical protein
MVKLSEALREGMKGMDQIHCDLFRISAGQCRGCCSLGAIMLASLGEGQCRNKGQSELSQELWNVRPELVSIENGSALLSHFNVHVENRGVIPKSLEWAIVYLNDEKCLPAAQIAEGLEAIGL